MQVLSGRPQRYGTQIQVDAEGRNVLCDLDDPDKVDERRRALGLGPLADYLESFGEPVIRNR